MTAQHEIPVFVFPTQLRFSGRARTQLLSLYNPYDFRVHFTILSTNPSAFALSSAQGHLRARHCLDITIRCRDDVIRDEKFLISLVATNDTRGQADTRSGQRVVGVTFGPEDEPREDEPRATDRFAPLAQTPDMTSTSRQLSSCPERSGQTLLGLMAGACVAALFVPDDWPLALGLAHKLVVAYLLGIFTVILIRN